jgi:hypothetical protein
MLLEKSNRFTLQEWTPQICLLLHVAPDNKLDFCTINPPISWGPFLQMSNAWDDSG